MCDTLLEIHLPPTWFLFVGFVVACVLSLLINLLFRQKHGVSWSSASDGFSFQNVPEIMVVLNSTIIEESNEGGGWLAEYQPEIIKYEGFTMGSLLLCLTPNFALLLFQSVYHLAHFVYIITSESNQASWKSWNNYETTSAHLINSGYVCHLVQCALLCYEAPWSNEPLLQEEKPCIPEVLYRKPLYYLLLFGFNLMLAFPILVTHCLFGFLIFSWFWGMMLFILWKLANLLPRFFNRIVFDHRRYHFVDSKKGKIMALLAFLLCWLVRRLFAFVLQLTILNSTNNAILFYHGTSYLQVVPFQRNLRSASCYESYLFTSLDSCFSFFSYLI